MLAWWAIVSGLTAARPRSVEIPNFLRCAAPPRGCRWPCFAASAGLHLAAVLLLPALSDWLAATQPAVWVRRYRLLPSVEIRVPERLYLASTGRRPARTNRLKAAPPRRDSRAGTPGRSNQSGGLQAGNRRPRRFQLPRLRARRTDQTLLQPDFPPDLPVLSRITLPQVFFWAPQPWPPLRIRKPFVIPGSAEPFAQPPRLDAPPQLAPPNWETLARELEAASALEGRPDSLLLPAISLPIQMAESAAPQPQTHVSIDRSVGDPLSVLALNPHLRPLREELIVPPGNQLAELLEAAGGLGPAGAEGSEAGKAGGGAASDAGREAAKAASPQGTSANPAAPGRQAQRAAGAPAASPESPRQAGPESRAAPVRADGDGRTASAAAPPVGTQVATAGQAPPGTGDPVGSALRVEHPPGGVFDVVVVQPGPIEGFPESSGALSGRPVYSVFLKVGAPREWILQYCVPAEDQSAVVSGGVIRLANPSPVTAPYPRVTYLPPLRPRPGAYLMIHGFLDAGGRFQRLEVLRAADREEGAAVLPVLDRWEFRPAMREGRPVEVEILLAIPRA